MRDVVDFPRAVSLYLLFAYRFHIVVHGTVISTIWIFSQLDYINLESHRVKFPELNFFEWSKLGQLTGGVMFQSHVRTAVIIIAAGCLATTEVLGQVPPSQINGIDDRVERSIGVIGGALRKNNLETIHQFAAKSAQSGGTPYLSILRGTLSGTSEDSMAQLILHEILAGHEGGLQGDWGSAAKNVGLDYGVARTTMDNDYRYIGNISSVFDSGNIKFSKQSGFIPVNQSYGQNGRSLRTTAYAAHNNSSGDFSGARVFGAPVDSDYDAYPDAVLVIGKKLCSGILIDPQHVLTAAHCICDGANEKVVVGSAITDATVADRVYNVSQSRTFIGCSAPLSTGDIGLLSLARRVADVTPRAIASSAMVSSSLFTRLVGFGATRDRGTGRKFFVDAFIASHDCTGSVRSGGGIAVGGQADEQFYGCRPGRELVAGGLDRDTCNGDSGGPGYILGSDGRLYVAVATSRVVSGNVRPCGDGGIYTRLDHSEILTWLRGHGANISVAQ